MVQVLQLDTSRCRAFGVSFDSYTSSSPASTMHFAKVKSNRRYIQSIIFCLLPVLLITGCIVIPIPTGEKPYYDAAITNLKVGVTHKSEVLAEFGVPDVTYNQGSELIYIETQESWKIAYIAEGGAGVDTLHKRFVLSLAFDTEDILSTYEYETAGDDFSDCTRHGICLGQANTVMRYADAVTNATAKEFKPIEERCSIYLHGPGNKKAYEVSLDSKIPVNMFSTGAFIQWMVKPGRHSVVIWPESAFLDFDCLGGEIVFLHFDYRWTEPSKLQMEYQLIGREHISNLRLALLPTGSEFSPLL